MYRVKTHRKDEGITEAGGGVGNLVRQLDVVVIDPAAVNLGDAVEACHALLREQRGENVANHTANTV